MKFYDDPNMRIAQEQWLRICAIRHIQKLEAIIQDDIDEMFKPSKTKVGITPDDIVIGLGVSP